MGGSLMPNAAVGLPLTFSLKRRRVLTHLLFFCLFQMWLLLEALVLPCVVCSLCCMPSRRKTEDGESP